MKTMKLLFTLLFVAGFATVGFSQITGTKHDFKAAGWNASGEICIACHTPHNGVDVDGAVLWNHAVTVAAFTPYTSGTMDATTAAPDGTSKLCLSCHDGTVGLEDFGGAGGTNYITGVGLVGTDLSNDHPISFIYDGTLATTDGELFDPSVALSGVSPAGTIGADLLSSTGSLECASCHDVHNSSGELYLLRKSNAASALCLTCHDK